MGRGTNRTATLASGSDAPGVPALTGYYNTPDQMNPEQLTFYREVERGLRSGKHVPLAGQIGYVFAFLYRCLAQWNSVGFESLHDYLTHVSELYSDEPKLADYCLFWAADCLLAREQFETFLERTVARTVTKSSTHQSNLRLNIQRHLGLPADPVDVVTMLQPRNSAVIRDSEGPFKTHLREVFDEHQVEHGDWYEFLLRDNYANGQTYEHRLFQGAPIGRSPKLGFKLQSYYSTHHGVTIVKKLVKDAENRLRAALKIPLIGEGWISETRLYRSLVTAFPQTLVVQHGQPTWLGQQHLDIWFPRWNIAVEYHGRQHFEPVEFFGGVSAFEETVKRDRRKQSLCRRHGVKLIVVTEVHPHEDVVDQVTRCWQELRQRILVPGPSE